MIRGPEHMLQVRVSEADWQHWCDYAQEHGFITLSEFVRHLLRERCGQAPVGTLKFDTIQMSRTAR